MSAIATPQITWNKTLCESIKQFTQQAETHSLTDKIQNQWEQVAILFENEHMNPIPWHNLGSLCRAVRDITEQVRKTNQTSLIESWKQVLDALTDSNTNIPRIDYKSTKRHFPLCRQFLDDGDTTFKVDRIAVLRTPEELSPELESYTNLFNELQKRTYGKNLGRRITKIWTRCSSTIVVYATNAQDQMLGQTQAMHLTVPLGDRERARVTLICGLAVTPEASRKGIASIIIPRLVEEILNDKEKENLKGITFGLQEGNSSMEQFLPIILDTFKSKMPENVEVEIIEGKTAFLPERITQRWIPIDAETQTRGAPTMEDLDSEMLEVSKSATVECGKSVAEFYSLAAQHFISAWFYRTSLGQYIQKQK